MSCEVAGLGQPGIPCTRERTACVAIGSRQQSLLAWTHEAGRCTCACPGIAVCVTLLLVVPQSADVSVTRQCTHQTSPRVWETKKTPVAHGFDVLPHLALSLLGVSEQFLNHCRSVRSFGVCATQVLCQAATLVLTRGGSGLISKSDVGQGSMRTWRSGRK